MAASVERAALRAAEAFGLSAGGGGLVGVHACTLSTVGGESKGACAHALCKATVVVEMVSLRQRRWVVAWSAHTGVPGAGSYLLRAKTS